MITLHQLLAQFHLYLPQYLEVFLTNYTELRNIIICSTNTVKLITQKTTTKKTNVPTSFNIIELWNQWIFSISVQMIRNSFKCQTYLLNIIRTVCFWTPSGTSYKHLHQFLVQFQLHLPQYAQPFWFNMNQFSYNQFTMKQSDSLWTNPIHFEPIYCKPIHYQPIWFTMNQLDFLWMKFTRNQFTMDQSVSLWTSTL